MPLTANQRAGKKTKKRVKFQAKVSSSAFMLVQCASTWVSKYESLRQFVSKKNKNITVHIQKVNSNNNISNKKNSRFVFMIIDDVE